MPNKTTLSDEQIQLLAAYLEGELSGSAALKFEQQLATNKTLQAQLTAAQQVKTQIQHTTDVNVPEWNRAAGFEKSQMNNPKSWWQWQGLPVLSMSFSIFAILLVIFNVNVQFNQNKLLVSFGHNSNLSNENYLTKTQVDEKITTVLQQFASEQQLVLANFNADLRNKQQQNNLQLANYLLSTSRKERKEDISDFIAYVNEQNRETNLAQKIKWQQLDRALKNSKPTIIPANQVINDTNEE